MSRNIYHNKFIIFVYYDVIHYNFKIKKENERVKNCGLKKSFP